MTAKALFEKTYRIRAYEVDFRDQAQPLTLLNFLQDAAGEHSLRLGVSVAELRPRGLTWVLSRYHLHVDRYPGRGEEVLLRTWPALREHKGTVRDFEIFDAAGKTLLKASSSWVVIDLATKRPVRLDDHLPPYPLLPRRALATEFPMPKALGEAEQEFPFRVRMTDLDLNRHVNNAVYAAWALEAVPETIQRTHVPSELRIAYRAEAFYGDRVLSRLRSVEKGPPAFIHQLLREADGRELTRLESRWTPCPPGLATTHRGVV